MTNEEYSWFKLFYLDKLKESMVGYNNFLEENKNINIEKIKIIKNEIIDKFLIERIYRIINQESEDIIFTEDGLKIIYKECYHFKGIFNKYIDLTSKIVSFKEHKKYKNEEEINNSYNKFLIELRKNAFKQAEVFSTMEDFEEYIIGTVHLENVKNKIYIEEKYGLVNAYNIAYCSKTQENKIFMQKEYDRLLYIIKEIEKKALQLYEQMYECTNDTDMRKKINQRKRKIIKELIKEAYVGVFKTTIEEKKQELEKYCIEEKQKNGVM